MEALGNSGQQWDIRSRFGRFIAVGKQANIDIELKKWISCPDVLTLQRFFLRSDPMAADAHMNTGLMYMVKDHQSPAAGYAEKVIDPLYLLYMIVPKD